MPFILKVIVSLVYSGSVGRRQEAFLCGQVILPHPRGFPSGGLVSPTAQRHAD